MLDRRELLLRLSALAALPLLDVTRAQQLFAWAEGARPVRASGYVPRALDEHQFETVTAIAELILPETETPGATAAGVNRFIDFLVDEWYTPEERARLFAGLLDLDARARGAHGVDFRHAAPVQQVALLEALEAEYFALREKYPERANALFFPTMKWLTLFGYYTSEAGATQELHWVAVPGSYRGCDPLAGHRHGEA